MRAALTVVLALGVAAGGCSSRCADSSDIRVVLDGDASAFEGVTVLDVNVDVADDIGHQPFGQADTPVALSGPLESGASLLLRPSASPSRSSYAIDITVRGIRSDGTTAVEGTLLGATVLASGCNELHVALVSTSGPGMDLGDGSVPQDHDDLSTTDASGPGDDLPRPDMASCVGLLPDEDGDNRGDVCDACPANAEVTQIDDDGDGLTTACDPAPAVAGNKRLWFQPYSAPIAGATVTGGSLKILNSTVCPAVRQTGTSLTGVASNFPIVVQGQITPKVYGAQSFAETKVYALRADDTGYGCALQYDTANAKYVLAGILGAVLNDPNVGGGTRVTQDVAGAFGPAGTPVRLRLILTATNVACEVATPGGLNAQTVTVGTTLVGPLTTVGIAGCWTDVDVASMFAAGTQ